MRPARGLRLEGDLARAPGKRRNGEQVPAGVPGRAHVSVAKGRERARPFDPARSRPIAPLERYWMTSIEPAGPGGAASGFVLSSSFQEIMRALAASFSASSIMFLRW